MRTAFALTLILTSGLGSTPLSASQSPTVVNATYEEFIALDADARSQQLSRMNPEAVARPADAAASKRQEELTHKLTCVLGVDNTSLHARVPGSAR